MGLFERLKTAEVERGDGSLDLVAEEEQGSRQPEAVWGKPSRCPECHEPGYLDHIDLIRRLMYQHCPSCFHRWETAEAETVQV